MRNFWMWLMVAGLIGSASLAFAQQDLSEKTVTLKYDQADVRYVLKQLFDSVGANYSLDPNVQGTVTVSITNAPFSVALRAVLDPLNLVAREEGGVYYVTVRRQEEVPTTTAPTETPEEEPQTNMPEKIQLNYANPQLIAALLGASIVGYANYEMGGAMMGGLGGFGGFGGLGGFGGFGGLGGFGGFGGLGGFGGMGGFGGFGGMGGFGGFGGLGGFGGGIRGGGGFGGGFGGGGFGGGFGR